jgi:hypothetical protein
MAGHGEVHERLCVCLCLCVTGAAATGATLGSPQSAPYLQRMYNAQLPAALHLVTLSHVVHDSHPCGRGDAAGCDACSIAAPSAPGAWGARGAEDAAGATAAAAICCQYSPPRPPAAAPVTAEEGSTCCASGACWQTFAVVGARHGGGCASAPAQRRRRTQQTGCVRCAVVVSKEHSNTRTVTAKPLINSLISSGRSINV